ncbi:MAG TPA: hypothetical protein VFI11_04100 [Anaerolineales bacterium]|nr:hypothetical protein [Anaerolineales bacterium]
MAPPPSPCPQIRLRARRPLRVRKSSPERGLIRRDVYIEAGGMVELALRELDARLLWVQPQPTSDS